MGNGIEFAPLAELSVHCETLLDGCRLPVANAVAYTNVAAENPQFSRHLFADIYVSRTCAVAPVALSRFDPGALLYGGDEFLLASRGRLLREQVPPYLAGEPQRLQRIVAAPRPTVHVAEECLLAARYGAYVWGHWLAELLPRIVLAEHRFPGRFRYVLPWRTATEQGPGSPMPRMRESLLAYGIAMNRVVAVHPDLNFRFARLHAISPVWSDHVLHPAAAALMRCRLPVAPQDAPAASQRICLVRAGLGRTLANSAEVHALLQAQGFTLHTLPDLPFAAQVALFRSAACIFAVLGSDLTGLIYAPEGVKVISAAPGIFGDRFFYALVLDRKGRYADLRGPIAERDPAVEHRSSFSIAPTEIQNALRVLDGGS